jgi:hypothetical protein
MLDEKIGVFEAFDVDAMGDGTWEDRNVLVYIGDFPPDFPTLLSGNDFRKALRQYWMHNHVWVQARMRGQPKLRWSQWDVRTFLQIEERCHLVVNAGQGIPKVFQVISRPNIYQSKRAPNKCRNSIVIAEEHLDDDEK